MNEQSAIRRQRRLSVLRDAISEFLRSVSEEGIFISLVDLRTHSSGSTASVYCSVFPETARERTYAFLRRQESVCKSYLKHHTSLRDVPTIRFKPAESIPFESAEKEVLE